jgi:hypothetical protein
MNRDTGISRLQTHVEYDLKRTTENLCLQTSNEIGNSLLFSC